MASSGCFAPVLPGETDRSGMVRGKRSTTDSGDGLTMALCSGGTEASGQTRRWGPCRLGSVHSGSVQRRPHNDPCQPLGGRWADRRENGDRPARKDEGVSPALGYGRRGFPTKIHLVTDGNGLPMAALLTAGQRHESAFFGDVMDQVVMGQVRGPRAHAPDERRSRFRATPAPCTR